MVTPLPCDVKHYFHTSCIENWLPYHNSCPLCKVDVTTDGIARVSRDYEEKFKKLAANDIRADQVDMESRACFQSDRLPANSV